MDEPMMQQVQEANVKQMRPQEMGPALWRNPILPTLGWSAGAIAAFHLAYTFTKFGLLMFIYLFCLLQLAHGRTWRHAFYSGLGVGLLTAGPQLICFWTVFGPGAVGLW